MALDDNFNKTRQKLDVEMKTKETADVFADTQKTDKVSRMTNASSLISKISDGSNPVSYTHLDVYKRQHLIFAHIGFGKLCL